MSNLHKRLEALEKRFVSHEPLVLTMPSGRIERIPLPGRNGLWRLYGEVIQGKRPREAELIRDCTEYNEPGGGHMVNLLHVLLAGPAEAQRNHTPEELEELDRSE